MNEQIVNYLKQNKDKYSQKSLIQQLKNAGHDEEKIQACVGAVYNNLVKKKINYKNKIVSAVVIAIIMFFGLIVLINSQTQSGKCFSNFDKESRKKCFVDTATKNSINADFCNSVMDIQKYKDECYLKVAVFDGNDKICLEINSSIIRDECLSVVESNN